MGLTHHFRGWRPRLFTITDSDSKSNAYIVLCRSFHTARSQIHIPILTVCYRNGIGIWVRNRVRLPQCKRAIIEEIQDLPLSDGTCASHWSDCVLIDGETLLQRMRAHVPVELVTSGEVEQSAEVLVMWYQSVKTPRGDIIWWINWLKVSVVIAGTFYPTIDPPLDSEHQQWGQRVWSSERWHVLYFHVMQLQTK